MGEQLFTLEQKDIDQLTTVAEVKVAMADIANDPRLTKIKKLKLQTQVIEKLKEIAARIAEQKKEQEKLIKEQEKIAKELALKSTDLVEHLYEKDFDKDLEMAYKQKFHIYDVEYNKGNIENITRIFVHQIKELVNFKYHHKYVVDLNEILEYINSRFRFIAQQSGLNLKKGVKPASLGNEKKTNADLFNPSKAKITGEIIVIDEKLIYKCNGLYKEFKIENYDALERAVRKFLTEHIFKD